MEGFTETTFETNEHVDPKFLSAKNAFENLVATDDGFEKIVALQEAIHAQFPAGSDMQQQAAKYGLYHAIIGSGTPEFTPELIEAFDTSNNYFTTMVHTYTGMSL